MFFLLRGIDKYNGWFQSMVESSEIVLGQEQGKDEL
jgi:hypothetical protein